MVKYMVEKNTIKDLPQMKLNPTGIKSLKTKPGSKITKYPDGGGLYLWVYADGKED